MSLAKVGCWHLSEALVETLKNALEQGSDDDFELIQVRPDLAGRMDYWILGELETWDAQAVLLGLAHQRSPGAGIAMVWTKSEPAPIERVHLPWLRVWAPSFRPENIRRELYSYLAWRGLEGSIALHDMLPLWLHDLNSPLCVLQSSLSFLDDTDVSKEDIEELVPECLDALRRVQGMVNNLRLWTRGVEGFEGSFLELADVVQGELSKLESTMRLQKLDVEMEIQRGLRVRGKLDVLKTLIRNLLCNAVEHAPTGSLLKILLQREGDRVVLTVADRGPRIDESRIADLTTLGGMVDLRHDNHRTGKGLNLLVASQLCRALGGTLSFKAAPDRGMVSLLKLPAF